MAPSLSRTHSHRFSPHLFHPPIIITIQWIEGIIIPLVPYQVTTPRDRQVASRESQYEPVPKIKVYSSRKKDYKR
jgi:hypothetical protein